MLKYLRLAVVAVCLLAGSQAFAQATVSVDIRKTSMMWAWAQGDGGIAAVFKVKCGGKPGEYTKVTDVVAPGRSVPVASVIDGAGLWYCAVTAANEYGESGPSSEIGFFAGDVPLSPSNFSIVSE